MTEVEALQSIDDLIQTLKIMKRTSIDAELLSKYISALDFVYTKMSLGTKIKNSVNLQFDGQITIDEVIAAEDSND